MVCPPPPSGRHVSGYQRPHCNEKRHHRRTMYTQPPDLGRVRRLGKVTTRGEEIMGCKPPQAGAPKKQAGGVEPALGSAPRGSVAPVRDRLVHRTSHAATPRSWYQQDRR